MSTIHAENVDGIPILVQRQQSADSVLIHVPGLGQAKEQAAHVLDIAAENGFHGIVMDAYQQGDLAVETPDKIFEQVFANFRREMWSRLGENVADIIRVAEWALDEFLDAEGVHLTGLSMGGDSVLAAAPYVPKVVCVNAVIAAPDWTRPGMRDFETGELVQQGSPNIKAQIFYDALCPMEHTGLFRSIPIHFILGEKDTNVPPEAAYRFKDKVGNPNHIEIKVLPEKGHLDFMGYDWTQDLKFEQVPSRLQPRD